MAVKLPAGADRKVAAFQMLFDGLVVVPSFGW